MIRFFLFFLSIGILCGTPAAKASPVLDEDQRSAVILSYGRVGEDSFPENNIRTERFMAHIQELADNGYNVLPLPEIIKTLKAGNTLPPRTLAITFDGGYRSIMDKAVPALLAKNLPFTVFYAADQADTGAGQYLGWDDLKRLRAQGGVTLGVLPAAYTHMLALPEEEMRRQINKARQRHREIFGEEAEFLSYPFGEYSKALETMAGETGFSAAFGLQSGSVYPGSNFMALPRFTMSEGYGDLERLRLVTHALPLPVTDIEPQDPYLPLERPVMGFSVGEELAPELKTLSCFVAGQKDPEIQIIGNRVEIRAAEPVTDSRVRINCTMPGPAAEPGEENISWRWFGLMLTGKPEAKAVNNTSDPETDEPQ